MISSDMPRPREATIGIGLRLDPNPPPASGSFREVYRAPCPPPAPKRRGIGLTADTSNPE
jgi:hypothetical protein